MKAHSFPTVILVALAGLLLAACSAISPPAAAEATPTAVPVVAADINVVAEGRLAPRENVDLSFFNTGQVAEILAEEGDQVKAGQVVARLGDREQIEAAIANAELELENAKLALKALSDNLPEEQTANLQALKEAREAVRDAERKLNGFDVPSEPLDIEVARANVALAKKALDQAEDKYKPYKNKSETNLRRASLLNQLSDAQERYDQAVRQLNRLTGVITPEFDLEQAQTELRIAQGQLELAQEKNDLLADGPDPDEVAATQARIKAAEAALASAQANLKNLELLATIDGTLVNQDLIIGGQVSAGQPVMTLADFSQMYVETDDLTELEVVDVSVGQGVLIVPDALPDLEIRGQVESINQIYEEKRGDITYTARILLDEVDPRLRWGMTVEVTFIEE
jgi:multidrug resistance efflux pump